MSRYKMCHLYDQIRTPDSQIAFLQKHDIFLTSHLCPDCETVSTTVKNRAGSKYYYYECEKCHKQTSIRKNTVLYKKGISLRSFLMIAYIFVMLNYTHEQIIHEVDLSGDEEEEPGEGPSLSCHTTVYYNNLLRNMIAEDMFNNSQDYQIGGPGTTVEVDESMFGKRKYRRGRINGRRQMETGECFLEECPGNKRDKTTLQALLVKRVRPGTKILTDGWAAYRGLEELGFLWDFVNHSENFRKPEDHTVHTNTIEGKWFCVKRSLPRSGDYNLVKYLPVYMWKEKMKRDKKDLYVELLAVVSKFNEEGVQEEHEDNQNQEDEGGPAVDTWHCLFCGTEFQQTVEKKNHLKVCIKKPDLQFQCLFCSSSFPTKRGKVTHLNTCKNKPKTV